MTYKELKNKIEKYEENRKTAFFVYGDHPGNQAKDMYYDAANKEKVALSALFNAYNLMENDIQVNSEVIKRSIDSFAELLNNESFLRENFNLEKQADVEMSGIDDFKKIYSVIFTEIFSLNERDKKKLIKYTKNKLDEIYKKQAQVKRNEDNKVINQLTLDVDSNYLKFTKDKSKRENTVYHVGTPSEVINAYISLITKEQIIYNLLMNAIKNALIGADSSESIEEDILTSYSSLETYPNDKKLYWDEEAYELSQNNFDLYKETYKNVFLLSKKSKSMLSKNLKSHLN